MNDIAKEIAEMEQEEKLDTVKVAGGKEHPTYASVLNRAHENKLKSIETTLLQPPLSSNGYLAIVHATVVFDDGKIFQGIGDASKGNTNSMIAPHIVRMAETRAKGRALRDALNIAEALKEELGGQDASSDETENDLGNCVRCGAPNKLSRNNKLYCSKFCWKNGEE